VRNLRSGTMGRNTAFSEAWSTSMRHRHMP
jgi:hypothetical protein